MPRRRVQPRVFPPYRTMVPLAWLRSVAAEALALVDPAGASGVSVVIAADETLYDLNRRFRGLDEVTDVLSFGANGEPLEVGPSAVEAPAFPATPGEQELGEVVLSYPQAVRQAGEHGWDVERELALLVVHGILHLLGHDHAEPEEERVMKGLEERVMARLFDAKEQVNA